MLLYRTAAGAVAVSDGRYYPVDGSWDELVNDDALAKRLAELVESTPSDADLAEAVAAPLAPLVSQEIWAAGVTYLRSRSARMEESRDAGGDDFYDRVYTADRPELFLKATPHRTVGTGDAMHLRGDSKWIVPEPELTLAVTRNSKIIGYTVGNDLSCRDMEGENPLYLPQAKTFSRCAAVGPCLLVTETPLEKSVRIQLRILRGGEVVVEDATSLDQLKRGLDELVGFLFRDNDHPNGCFLMTGTGIVPQDDFCLEAGDVVEVEIDGIGCLKNPME